MSRKFLPTADTRRRDVWSSINNMIPTEKGSYQTPNCFSATAATVATPGTTLAAWVGQTAAGTAVMYCGTTLKLYTFTAAASFTDRSRGGGYTNTATKWRFEQFGNMTLATNGVDPIQVRDASGGGAFADLGGSPPTTAKILVVQSNAVLAFNLNSGGNYWAASDVGDHANWTTGEAVAATPIIQRPGPITAAVPFQGGVLVFKESSIYRMQYVGSPIYWTVELIADGLGTTTQEQVVVCGDQVFFMGPWGAHTFDGATFRNIGEGVFTSGRTAAKASVYWPFSNSVWVQEATNSVYVYNFASDAWGSFGMLKSDGTGTTALSAHYLLTGSPASINAVGSSITDANALAVDVASTTNTVMRGNTQFSGSGASAYVQTGFEGLGPNVDTLFSRVQPLVVDLINGPVVTTQPGATAFTLAGLPVNTPESFGSETISATSNHATYRMDFQATAKYARFKITSSATFAIDDVVITMAPAGNT